MVFWYLWGGGCYSVIDDIIPKRTNAFNHPAFNGGTMCTEMCAV